MTEATERQLVRLFQDILYTLPPNCASLRIKEAPKDKGIRDLAIVPANTRSAEFGVILMSGELYAAFFGPERLSTTYECPWEIGLSKRDGLAEHLAVIEKMCLAVIAGRCEHRYRRWGIEGVIHVSEEKIYRVSDVGLLRFFFPRRDPKIIQYAPYYPGAEKHSRSFPKLSL